MENTLSLYINKELDGKHILVTGVTKGIDRSIVDRLLNAGATIITTARTMLNDLSVLY
jgi:NAD(P)-dependent dehydrogenase (short-subunit alcohol dehydrogenase family)